MSNELFLDGSSYVLFPKNDSFYEDRSLYVDLKVELPDWNADFSTQIIGNFQNQGWGVFYEKGFTDIERFTILDSGNTHQVTYNSSGSTISQRGFPLSDTQSNITAYVVDADESKYYFDQARSKIYKYNATDILVAEGDVPEGTTCDYMSVDDIGFLYLLDKTTQSIMIIATLTLEFQRSVGLDSNDPLLIDSKVSHNNFLVTPDYKIRTFYSNENTPMLMDTEGNYYNLFGVNLYKNGVAFFYVGPQANTFGIDLNDNLWIVYEGNRIIKMDRDGVIEFNRQFHDITPCESFNCPPDTNVVDKVGIGFVKSGSVVETWVVLSKTNFLIKLNMDGVATICNLFSNALDVESYDYLDYGVVNIQVGNDFTGFYTKKKFALRDSTIARSRLVLRIAVEEVCSGGVVTFHTLSADVTGLESGKHQITVGFEGGDMTSELYLDGVLQDSITGGTEGNIYYEKDRKPPTIIGAESGIYRAKKEELGIKDPVFLQGVVSDVVLGTSENSKLFQVLFIPDLNMEFELQTPRSYVETVDKFFLFRPAGFKSNRYDITIKNNCLGDEDLRTFIEGDIVETVEKNAPVQTSVRDIRWKNDNRISNMITLLTDDKGVVLIDNTADNVPLSE